MAWTLVVGGNIKIWFFCLALFKTEHTSSHTCVRQPVKGKTMCAYHKYNQKKNKTKYTVKLLCYLKQVAAKLVPLTKVWLYFHCQSCFGAGFVVLSCGAIRNHKYAMYSVLNCVFLAISKKVGLCKNTFLIFLKARVTSISQREHISIYTGKNDYINNALFSDLIDKK